MSKLINLRLKSKRLVTAFGLLKFNEEGIVELPKEQADKFLNMKYFSVVEEQPEIEQEATKDSTVVNSSEQEENTQENKESTSEDNNQDAPSEEIPNFKSMNVAQLKKYAREHDIDLKGANKKDEIISSILSHNK